MDARRNGLMRQDMDELVDVCTRGCMDQHMKKLLNAWKKDGCTGN